MKNIKSHFAAITLIAGALFISHYSQAADGTINFTGSITDTACTVTSASQNVDMGAVAASSLSGAAGKKAAATQFDIALTDCPADVGNVEVKFDGPADAANTELLEIETGALAASGVGIEFSDREEQHIKLGENSAPYAIQAGANTLTFYASYMATADAVTAGSANSTAQFTMVYP